MSTDFKKEFLTMMDNTQGNYILCCSSKGMTPNEVQIIRDDDEVFDKNVKVIINRRNAEIVQKIYTQAMSSDRESHKYLRILTDTPEFKEFMGIVTEKPSPKETHVSLTEDDKKWFEESKRNLVESDIASAKEKTKKDNTPF